MPKKKQWLSFKYLVIFVLFFFGLQAQAHVKWFVEFSFSDKPRALQEVLTPLFYGLALLTTAVIGILLRLDKRLRSMGWFGQVNEWLEARKAYSGLVIRTAMGAVMLLCWQSDALLVPELSISSPLIGWTHFAVVLLLIFGQTTPIAGFLLLCLYLHGIYRFGGLHMLDYLSYAGVSWYLMVHQMEKHPPIRGTGLPALYATVGFSLCWVALEKVFFPQWGMHVLSEQPQLTLGFALDFFLTGAAFVEFGLGYLLIMGLLQRPMALVITVIFLSTTMIFGKVEVIGHTMLHAILLVFILKGPGSYYKVPIRWFSGYKRIAFVTGGYLVLLATITFSYSYLSNAYYNTHKDHHGMVHKEVDTSTWENPPQITLTAHPDSMGGWNLEMQTEHFQFTPEAAGKSHEDGKGHIHLYINDKKAARLYGSWYHLDHLGPGKNDIKAVLSTNDHGTYIKDSKPIYASVTIEAKTETH